MVNRPHLKLWGKRRLCCTLISLSSGDNDPVVVGLLVVAVVVGSAERLNL